MATDLQLKTLIEINQQLQKSEGFTRTLGKLNETLGLELNSALTQLRRHSASVQDIVELQAKGNDDLKTQLKVRKQLKNLEADILLVELSRKSLTNALNTTQKNQLDLFKVTVKQVETIEKSQAEALEIDIKSLATLALQNAQIKKNKDIADDLVTATAKMHSIAKNDAYVLQPFILEQEAEKLELIRRELDAIDKKSNKYKILFGQTLEFTKKMKIGQAIGGSIMALAAAVGVTLTLGGIMKSMLDTFFKVDVSATNIAKSSGTTKEFTSELVKSYREIVNSGESYNKNLDKTLVTNTALLDAQMELQNSTEASSLYTKSSVENQLYLTKQIGLSAEEATKVNALGIINNSTTDSVTDSVYDQTAAINTQYGIRLKGKAVLADVAKVEGVLAANYKNNPKLLAAAVAQAKALGTNLQTAAAASGALLDFESSIENQLEAEFLTGKKFNLEKARSLALDGDAAGAAAEILKNVGSLNEFQNLNVLAKEAEAKAAGMTVDELANTLKQAELLKGLNRETLKGYNETLASIQNSADKEKYLGMLRSANSGEQLQAAEKAVSSQQKFEAVLDSIKDTIGQIGAGPISRLITGFASFVEKAHNLKGVLIGVAAIMAGMAIAATIISGGANLALAIPALGLTAGAIAGTGLLAGGLVAGGTAYALNDGVVDPNGGIVLSTPKGKIQTNKDDSIIATTNPGALLGGGGGGKTEQLLSAILNAVSKPSGVYLDTQRVGTAQGMSRSVYA